jgi:hypothetical protein
VSRFLPLEFIASRALMLKRDESELCRYENADVALNTGMILRAMLRHEPLARALLYSDK